MKLAFIAMSGMRVHNSELKKLGLTLPGFIERKEVIASLPSLSLLTLASLTPSYIDVEYVDLDDFNSDMPLPGNYDAVAISSYSAQINTAYLLADRYRENGTIVILGGLHVTALPEEASIHADAIVLGEAEPIWGKVIGDLKSGNLKEIYDARYIEFDFTLAPLPRYELLDIHKYNRLTVQTQRGCPFKCEFCASSIQITKKYKTKPISKVVEEVEYIKSVWKNPFIELADDNTFANRRHSVELAKALARQDVKWFTETDISIAENEELLSILSDSGCRQLLIGFESPGISGLHNLEMKGNWKERQADKYLSAIEKIQRLGISVNGCFILGLDDHDSSIFDRTLSFVKESGLSEVQITILTPFPGTPLYERLSKENRLIDSVFWDKCTLFDVAYHPKNMTIQELESGFYELMRNVYSENLVRERKQQFIERSRRNARMKYSEHMPEMGG